MIARHATTLTRQVGCGAGNTVFPILDLNPHIRVYACDFSHTAVEIVKAHPAYATSGRVMAFQVFEYVWACLRVRYMNAYGPARFLFSGSLPAILPLLYLSHPPSLPSLPLPSSSSPGRHRQGRPDPVHPSRIRGYRLYDLHLVRHLTR